MLKGFTTIDYFFDLAALALILIPSIFLPVSALVKRIIFSIAGAYLLFFIAPRLFFFYLVFWSLVILLQWFVAALAETRWSTYSFWAAVLATLFPMLYWKLNYDETNYKFNIFLNELIGQLSPSLQEIDYAANIIIPIGLSFATFRAIDLLIKTWIGKFDRLRPNQIYFYGFFPPVQVIGPIIQYEEIQKASESFPRPEPEQFVAGSVRVALGYLKFVFVGVVLAPAGSIFQSYPDEATSLIWGYLFLYTWFFYLNFSAFSDIAIGFSRIFGFRIKENFAYPFFQKNIADFWNCWHMSLSHFAQRNIYVPMGGYRKESQYIATFFTIMVIALWHDITLGMTVFGLYHGAGLIAHRAFLNWRGDAANEGGPLSKIARILVTYVFVSCSFPLLVMPLPEAGNFYLALIGAN